MKLKLSCITLLTLLMVAPAMGKMATNTVILNNCEYEVDSGYDDWFDFYYENRHYYIDDANIHINSNIKTGKYDVTTIEWSGNSDTTYKLTGSGKINNDWTDWQLGEGTYVLESKGSPGAWDVISSWEDDSHLVFNNAFSVDCVYGFQSITFNNKNCKINYLDDIGIIYANTEISTKNISNLLNNQTIVGNIIINGASKDTPILTDGYNTSTRIYGNAKISGKTTVIYDLNYYGDGDCDECGAWTKNPPQEMIDEVIETLGDGFVFFSCDSYTGKLSNLTFSLGYGKHVKESDEFCYYINESYKTVKTGNLGAFVAMYNEYEECFDIVFKPYAVATNVMDMYPCESTLEGDIYAVWGDMYLPKAVNVPGKNHTILEWYGGGASCVLMGKGAISAKGGLTVKLAGGSFSMMTGCSFKNAAYELDSARLFLDSALTANSLNMVSESTLVLSSEKALKLSVKDKKADNIIDGYSTLNVNGSMSVDGHLQVSDGSTITLSGALSATNLTLNDATLHLNSTKQQTVKVKNSLTLSGENSIYLAFNVKEKEVNKKQFKLFTFKTSNLNSSSDLYALLGLDESYCSLTLDKKQTSILLTVTDYKEWNKYITSGASEYLITTSATEQEHQTAEGSDSTPPIVTASAVDAALAKVSDTLVQTTWGAAKASRAFVDSIDGRGQNATALNGGRGAAWGTALGASSRQSSRGAAQGADYNMGGAAVGAEINATEKHNIGVAMGYTWGKVNTFSAYAADQDTTHFALYGQSKLKKTANGELTLDWSAAYGRSENEADLMGERYDWTQHSAQLDARLSYARTLNERTVVRAFGGVQYLHVDAATPTAGVKADSLENLRVELGVGATWMATAKTALNGEVSFIGDMLRDNPAAVVGGTCRSGANPGRAGVNIGVGATHQLNESWSVNAGYNLELVPHATNHSASAGATYRF